MTCMRHRPTVSVLLLSTALVASVPLAAQAARHDGIDAVYREFVSGYARLDPDQVAALYTQDALYVSSRSPAEIGREAIRANFAGFFDAVRADGATLQLQFRIVERRVEDDAAWDLGFYHLRRVVGDSLGRPSVGRFVTGSVRDEGGRWRFVLDSFEQSDLDAWNAAARGIEP